MTDINKDPNIRQNGKPDGIRVPTDKAHVETLLTDANLVDLIELIFFAYRDFTGDPDTILREYGFGRAHHRVLHFVDRHPGLRVADLLDILKITKQSLARVLKQLVDEGFIDQKPGLADRRERRLFTTERGHALAVRLIEPQLLRIERALRQSGDETSMANKKFLYYMINSKERDEVLALFLRPERETVADEKETESDPPESLEPQADR